MKLVYCVFFTILWLVTLGMLDIRVSFSDGSVLRFDGWGERLFSKSQRSDEK